jgi:hypothetical protein
MSVRKTDSPISGSMRDDDDAKAPYIIDQQPDFESSQPIPLIDHHAERALCRKFDFRLLPVLAVMYLFNALDKGNLGNAKTAGLEKDLHFKGNQYNIILSVFYVPYVLFAPPFVRLSQDECSTRYKTLTSVGDAREEIWSCSSPSHHDVLLWKHDCSRW